MKLSEREMAGKKSSSAAVLLVRVRPISIEAELRDFGLEEEEEE